MTGGSVAETSSLVTQVFKTLLLLYLYTKFIIIVIQCGKSGSAIGDTDLTSKTAKPSPNNLPHCLMALHSPEKLVCPKMASFSLV